MGAIINRGTRHAPRFYAQYRDATGVRRTKRLKGAATAEQADGMLNAIERNIMQGKLGIEEPTPQEQARGRITVAELSEQFLKEYAPPRIKDISNYRVEARSVHNVRILPTLKARAAASVTTADVERLRDQQLTAKLTPASVVQTLAALSKLYEWARKVGLVDCANPVHGVERPRAQHSIDYLKREEVQLLLSAAAELAAASVTTPATRVLHPMVTTAIYCGLRKGELTGLTWASVHLEQARIDVVRSYRVAPKSGLARHVPMHPELVRILRAWQPACPPSKEGLVFPFIGPRAAYMASANDDRGLRELLRLAGCHVPKKPWHALRHTFASHAVMSGTPLYDVQKLLGHSTPMMTQRYAHLAPDHLMAAVARLSFAAPPTTGVADLGEERRRRAAQEATDVQATYERQHEQSERSTTGGEKP
jgi:integrase